VTQTNWRACGEPPHLIDATGSFVASFTVSTALLVVGGLAALWIGPTKRLPDVEPSVPAAAG
jgi:hypothetical protein